MYQNSTDDLYHFTSGANNQSLSQLAQTAQDLTNKLQTVNNLVSKAWCEHELAREMLQDLITAYDAWQESMSKR